MRNVDGQLVLKYVDAIERNQTSKSTCCMMIMCTLL